MYSIAWLLDRAKEAVQKAMIFSLELYLKNQCITKKDKSPVSLADLGCQLIIKMHLRNSGISQWIAEEDSDSFLSLKNSIADSDWKAFLLSIQQHGGIQDEDTALALLDAQSASGAKEPNLFWVLDPIDGTMGYLRGDQYAICLSLLDMNLGKVLLGVIGCPRLVLPLNNQESNCKNYGTIFHALESKEGVFSERIVDIGGSISYHVSDCQNPSELICCESVPSTGHSKHGIWKEIYKQLVQGSDQYQVSIDEPHIIQMDSQAKYCLVASGQAHVYIRWPLDPKYIEKIWDHAAGALLVEQAGGKVTDLDGEPLIFNTGSDILERNRGILATCGEPIHSRIINSMKQLKN
jgi:3'(2'), 5'-bisphosphate nucleotidase